MTQLLVVGANPPKRRKNWGGVKSESQTLAFALAKLEGIKKDLPSTGTLRLEISDIIGMLVDLQVQATRGIHRNPAGQQLARKVLRLDYVHVEDGEEYTHDFTEDASKVTATVVEDGRKVILKAVDGRKIVEDF